MKISKVGKVACLLFLCAGSQGHAGQLQAFGPNGNYEGVIMGVGPNAAQAFDSNGDYRGTIFATPSLSESMEAAQQSIRSQGQADLSSVGKSGDAAIHSLKSLTGIDP